MDGESFYENFKEALRFFGLKWSEMDKMIVRISDFGITYSYQNRTITVQLEKAQ